MAPLRDQIRIPTLVRVKPAAVRRLGIYLDRLQLKSIFLMTSEGLPENITRALHDGLSESHVTIARQSEAQTNDFEHATQQAAHLSGGVAAIVGVGGGKALDVAKYIAFLAGVPFIAVPTSLSNDGFCSPQSSLTIDGRRRSMPSAMPYGVVVDNEICLNAPLSLWCSGVGDLAAKLTAVIDWKIAFHKAGTPVNDFAALIADSTFFQFMANPEHSLEGMELLGTALMLNGITMEIAGSSRPASGSEHLISHAYDQIASRPRLHGIQVGVATYLVSQLQKQNTERIGKLFVRTGFWEAVHADPFLRDEWLEACRIAPTIKDNFYTVLSTRDCLPEIERLMDDDPYLAACFR